MERRGMTARACRRTAAAILTIALAAAGMSAAAEETLAAYNTYQAVPFVVDKGGLAADVVAYLNTKLKGKYKLQLENVPRKKLNETIEADANFKGVVLFLNPMFVNDADKKKFYWTPSFLSDANAVISPAAKKVEYSDPASLNGLRFAGVVGNRYAGLEERFGKELQREDVTEELSNLKKIASGRADVTIMPFSTYRFLLKQLGSQSPLSSTLYVSQKPHAKFDRFIFVSKNDAALGKELDAVVAGMKSDPAWKAVLSRYDLE
ncbi:MAG TPA: transporter substrate-binding domain-containing protein [Paucimonas sp.]|nr:transporter substrate-binding domain-containing protein [Paucimonas sp.]